MMGRYTQLRRDFLAHVRRYTDSYVREDYGYD